MCILLVGAMYANTLRFVKYWYIETCYVGQLFWYVLISFQFKKITDHTKIGHWTIHKWTKFRQKFSSFVSHVMRISGYIYTYLSTQKYLLPSYVYSKLFAFTAMALVRWSKAAWYRCNSIDEGDIAVQVNIFVCFANHLEKWRKGNIL